MTLFGRPFPRRLAINSGSILAGEASARLATFLVALVLARRFGSVALGQYGFAVAVASVLLLIPDAGLHLFMVRELAAAPGRLPSVYRGVHWLKAPLLAFVLASSLIFGEWVIHDDGRRMLFYVLLAKVALQTFSQAYMAIFKAFERMHRVAVQQFANALLAAAWVGGALWIKAGPTAVILALVVGQVVETGMGWWMVKRDFLPRFRHEESTADLKPMLVASVPMGVAAILLALDLRLDILTLSPFASNRDLGIYQAAAWFPVGAFLAVSLLMTTLFPKLARHLRNPGAVGNAYVESLLKNGILFMAAVSVIVGLIAPSLLKLLFGEELLSAVSLLRVLIAALPCIFINTTMFHVFVAAQRRRAYLTALILGISVGGALSLLLSSQLGPGGTAFAVVLRELVVSVVYLRFLKVGNFAQSAGRALLRILACATTLILLAVLLSGYSIFERGSGAAWNLSLLVGTLAFMGWPRMREMQLLADDDL